MFPPVVRRVMEIISGAGYEVYVVGGAVRDMLLGREPKEYDICTSACPVAVLTLAAENGIKAYKKGAAFGVVAWILEGQEIEICTFRTELYGDDAHRPEKVEFVWALEDDLARRDFTVNAIAMRPDGRIEDPFGGQADLKAGILRAVGDPEERFEEDALRMFRACRFVAEYGFRLALGTKEAIARSLDRVAGLSVERVRDEIDKTLQAEFAAKGLELLRDTGLLATTCRGRVNGRTVALPVLPEVSRLAGVEQNPEYHQLDVWEHTLRVVAGVPSDPVLRWAALLHDVAKGLPGTRCVNRRGLPADYGHAGRGAEITREILERLRFSPSFVRRVTWLVRHHMNHPRPTEQAVMKWLRRLASDFHGRTALLEAVEQSLVLRKADILGGKVDPARVLAENERLREVVAKVTSQVPFYAEDLAISGGEVAELVGRGPQVKQVMDDLVVRIQGGHLENEPAALKEAVRKRAWRKQMLDAGQRSANRG